MAEELFDPTPVLEWIEARGYDTALAARILGVNRRQIQRWRNGEHLRLHTADRVAINSVGHMSLFWPVMPPVERPKWLTAA